MPALHRWLLCFAALILGGCATLQQQGPAQSGSPPETYQQHIASLAHITRFNLQGRMGVQTDGRGFSGAAHWQHEAASETIVLFSPLGSQVAKIEQTVNGVTLLTEDAKRYEAATAESLTQDTLGWTLPMKGLPDWVLGRPADGPIEDIGWDERGRLTMLKQNGWKIEYSQYMEINDISLPGKIFLASPKVNLKLLVERWDTDNVQSQP